MLGVCGEIGDGVVSRMCAEVQARYWRPQPIPRAQSRWNRRDAIKAVQ